MNAFVPQLAVQKVADFVAAQAPADVVLLDVREAWELQAARLDLPGARTQHIPMGTLPARLHELDRAQPILVLCHHGARSQQCVAFLQRQGFDAVYNIAGGIEAWSRSVDAAVPRY
jgi:rhodanese-related sulfurtransferase